MLAKTNFVAGVVFGSVLSLPALAAQETALDPSGRVEIVQALTAKMNAHYIEPAVAARVGRAIARKNAEGGYASAVSAQSFSASRWRRTCAT